MNSPPNPPRLRSRAWFDDPENADMTALYLERYMNFGLTLGDRNAGAGTHRRSASEGSPVAAIPNQYPPVHRSGRRDVAGRPAHARSLRRGFGSLARAGYES